MFVCDFSTSEVVSTPVSAATPQISNIVTPRSLTKPTSAYSSSSLRPTSVTTISPLPVMASVPRGTPAPALQNSAILTVDSRLSSATLLQVVHVKTR